MGKIANETTIASDQIANETNIAIDPVIANETNIASDQIANDSKANEYLPKLQAASKGTKSISAFFAKKN
ncbi:hypothetical protein CRE_25680 [Caenorhabditis remanei]|uniref:Uncharacterized protein n=1 Tax=Caenorhabditis remanei TaxID=31234 RepID=E3MLF3_CAERE|nr:hypothetical protein CRE_25680 [Caenorhabditis remanei]